MAPLRDSISIYVSLLCILAACLLYLILGLSRRANANIALQSVARAMYTLSVLALAFSFGYLLLAILSGRRYDIEYIFQNSGPRDALIYKISALWAGQAGSLLLWALLSGLIGAILQRKLGRGAPLLMSFWCLIQLFFGIILVLGNPFRPLAGFVPGTVGEGLHPLLKNPWMAIHPPVIFLGYALSAVPAAFSVQALIDGQSRKWANRALPWALWGWTALSAGLILGMVWSYEVLGWGGYWGWDPVENASLIPWLTSGALVHGLLVQRYRGRMTGANILLSLTTFLLVIYATFLTRSGVLAKISVHSFAGDSAHHFLLWSLVFFVILCYGLAVFRWRKVNSSDSKLPWGNRAIALVWGIITLALFAAMVFIGTSRPLFGNQTLGPQFYNHLSLPLSICVVALIVIASFVRWSGSSPAEMLPVWVLSICAVAAVPVGLLAVRFPKIAGEIVPWPILHSSPAMAFAAVSGGVFLLTAAVFALIVNLIKCCGASPLRVGAYFSHTGVSLLIVGIVLSSLGTTVPVTLEKGKGFKSIFGYAMKYSGAVRQGDTRELIRVGIQRGNRKYILPLLMETTSRGIIRSPHIVSTITGDLYLSPVAVHNVVISPTVCVTNDGGLQPIPVRITGSSAKLELIRMSVESKSVLLRITLPTGKSKEVIVSAAKPGRIGNNVIIFRQFFAGSITAGVELTLTGRNFPERAIIEASNKPFIWIMWLGAILMVTGGVFAAVRRLSENVKLEDGILPDNN